MHYMFYGCKAKLLNLSSFNTSNVTDMNRMFAECKAKSIDLSSFDASNVIYMNYMFAECQSLCFLLIFDYITFFTILTRRLMNQCI